MSAKEAFFARSWFSSGSGHRMRAAPTASHVRMHCRPSADRASTERGGVLVPGALSPKSDPSFDFNSVDNIVRW
jgi:hypothetical protein